MKVSTRKQDDCFVAKKNRRGVEILLDDKLMKNVVYADDESGTVVLFNDDGSEETRIGRVQIRTPDNR